MRAGALFPALESGGFWIIIGVMFTFSAIMFTFHFGIMRRWRTRTILDRVFDWRRARLVEAYFGSGEGGEEGNDLFVGLPVAVGSGLLGLGTLILKVASGGDGGVLATVAVCILYGGAGLSAFIASRRRRLGPPERIKPKWLVDEENRREKSGEIVRYGRGWAKSVK